MFFFNQQQQVVKYILVVAGSAALLVAGCQSSEQTSDPVNSPIPSQTVTILPSISPSVPPSPSVSPEPEPDISLESIQFEYTELTIAPEQQFRLTVRGFDADRQPVAIEEADAVIFTSDKPDIVFVDREGSIQPGQEAVIGARTSIHAEYKGLSAVATVTVKYALEDTVISVSGRNVVTNETDIAVVVNKNRGLPDSYEPTDLVEPQVSFSFSEPHEKRYMRREAAEALEELFGMARDDGIRLLAVSGYRSRTTQTAVYNNHVRTKGQEAADQVSAAPGYSEHQTGLAMDVTSASVNYGLTQAFGSTEEGEWLRDNAHRAGFIIRYLEGKESITGYSYEPWHLRFVGEQIANDIYENGWTLEEYFQDALPVSSNPEL